MNSTKKYLLVIAGPTAVGKTDIAIQTAKYFNTCIVSADSRQVYKELNIGVAKPSAQQLKDVQHYFINHISIHDEYTAKQYNEEAYKILKSEFSKHNVIIVTGGTGFYINALLESLDDIPAISSKTKNFVREHYKNYGIQYLQDTLKKLDEVYYKQVDVNNPMRLIRALEVCIETNRPFSSFLNQKNIYMPDFIPIKIWLNTSRENLYERINKRVDEMISCGLEQEVKELYTYRNLNALNTVGYKEWWDYFENKTDKQTVIEKIKQHTRNYAKRQITWFNNKYNGTELMLSDNNTLINQILKFTENTMAD